MRYAGGMTGRMHRTSSLDYGVVLGGSIVLQLEDGAEVVLEAGDVLVQRGTAHNWINRGSEPCTMAFVLIDALPLSAS
jgi:quercetin dioxygenase-like cupin family protein